MIDNFAIYWYEPAEGGSFNLQHSEYIHCNLLSEDDGVKYYRTHLMSEIRDFSIIQINGNHVLHNISKPAYTYVNENASSTNNNWRYEFYVEGMPCRIEELPCDDETKCILALKYVHVVDHLYV